MQEGYYGGGGVRRLSRAEIRRMKENMQKVPLVQEKSNRYHKKEVEEAEALLENLEAFETHESKQAPQEEKIWFFQKIKNFLFHKS